MTLEGKYKFPNQWGIEFINPTMEIKPVVNNVNPSTMTIDVEIVFTVDSENIKGKFIPNINPVPVNNLDYNSDELVERVLTRLKDFIV